MIQTTNDMTLLTWLHLTSTFSNVHSLQIVAIVITILLATTRFIQDINAKGGLRKYIKALRLKL